jgi:hypothetical protein
MASDLFVIGLMIFPPVAGDRAVALHRKTPHPKNAGHLNLFPISPPIAAARLQTAASGAPKERNSH